MPALRLADGRVRIDLELQQVELDGEVRPVQPVVYRFLLHLAQRPDRVLSRTELVRAVWGGAHVVPDAVSQVARKARRAIGDDGDEPRWLLAVARTGYRLVGPVEPEDPADGAGGDAEPVGREALLLQLGSLLSARDTAGARPAARGTLVTLVGPAGVGKSRLARAAAAAAWPAWHRVDLGGVRDADTAEDRLRAALQLTPGADVPRTLAGRADAAILLDDIEDVAVVAPALDGWRRPPIRWLCTAREPLGLDGERVVEVPGLDPTAAAALWSARSPDPPPHDLGALDGLPLAIEIVAAHRDVVGADPLHAVLALPHEPGGDSLDTVLAAIAAVLPDAQRRALLALSVLAGAFGPDVARRLGVDAPSLAALRRRSLLRTDGARLRVWGVTRAWFRAAPDPDGVRERTRARLDEVLLAGANLPDDLPAAIDRALDDGDADRAARLALALTPASGRTAPHVARLQRVVALDLAPVQRSRVRSLLARRLPPSAARPLAELALVEAGDHRVARAEAHRALARAALEHGDAATALREAEAACADLLPGSVEHARMLVTLANAAGFVGDFERAVELQAVAAATLDGAGEVRGAVIARANLAMTALELGRVAEAEAWLRRCREVRERTGDGVGLAHAAVNEAAVHVARGRFAEAARAFAEGADLHRRHGAVGDEVNSVVSRAMVRLEVHGGDVTAEIHEARQAALEPAGLAMQTVSMLVAAQLAAQGRWEDVLVTLDTPISAFDRAVDCQLLRAEARLALEGPGAALVELPPSRSGLRGARVDGARAWLLARDGRPDEAHRVLAAVRLAPLEAPGDLWEPRVALARARVAAGEPGAAEEVARIAAAVGLGPEGAALTRWTRADSASTRP